PINALFCFDFLIENIDVLIGADLQIQRIDFKLDQYEWRSIEEVEWTNVGRRCYFLSDSDFLEKLSKKRLRLRAFANDNSSHSCDINLNSFTVHESTAYCKGAMELFSTMDIIRSVRLFVAMRIFNVDSIHPMPIHHSLINVDHSVQTYTIPLKHKRIQAQPTHRSAAIQTTLTRGTNVEIQTNSRYVPLTTDTSTQCTARWYHKQVEKAVIEVINRILTTRNFVSSIQIRPSNRQMLGLPRTRFDTSVHTLSGRRPLRWIPNSGLHSTSGIGFNVICRNQLIRSLDRIIAYKQHLSTQQATTLIRKEPIRRLVENDVHSSNRAKHSKRAENSRDESISGQNIQISEKLLSDESESKRSTLSSNSSSSTTSNTTISSVPHSKRRLSSRSSGGTRAPSRGDATSKSSTASTASSSKLSSFRE
uniref:Uncharacterized protein n=1 Tax=Parascaris univalens TaxID=6257 RepID=A0A915BDW6_PARUN